MRFLLSLLLVVLAVGAAIGSGAGAMLSRNVLDVNGFTAVVVGTAQSPAGQQLVRTTVANGLVERAAAGGYDGLVVRAAASAAGDWAATAIRGKAATRVLASAAVGLQQGILTGTQSGAVTFDLRAFVSALEPPPAVATALAALPGPLEVEVPWIEVSPGAQTLLQELDRHRWLPAGLAVAAITLGFLALVVSRRRGFTLILLGLLLAVVAWLLRPVATGAATAMVSRNGADPSTGTLADAFVEHLFAGWGAVSGALIAIGAALVLLGLVFSLRRRS